MLNVGCSRVILLSVRVSLLSQLYLNELRSLSTTAVDGHVLKQSTFALVSS